jgi:hypothetical protein
MGNQRCHLNSSREYCLSFSSRYNEANVLRPPFSFGPHYKLVSSSSHHIRL